jgi:hypothetical protein
MERCGRYWRLGAGRGSLSSPTKFRFMLNQNMVFEAQISQIIAEKKNSFALSV